MSGDTLPTPSIRQEIERRLVATSASSSADSPWNNAAEEAGVWRRASGGLSEATVWQVGVGDQEFAVRRWWAGIDPSYLWWMAETLRAAATRGAPYVAAPFGGSLDRWWPFRDSGKGRWEAAVWMPGDPLSERYDERSVSAAIGGLARFHDRVPKNEARPPTASNTLEERQRRLAALLRDHPFAVSPRTVERWPDLGPISEHLPMACALAAQQLAACDETTTPQPIHGDARPEHFLLQDGVLTGLIDFGAMRVDSVLADVARLAGELAAGDADRRDHLAGLYEAASGTPTPRQTIAALDASAAVISAANWLRWLGEPDPPARDTALVAQRLRSIRMRLPV